MSYNYNKDDIFYDVESLANVFTVAWWYPNKDINAIILSYIDDDNVIQTQDHFDLIRQKIYEFHPVLTEMGTNIFFENIKQTGSVPENTPDNTLVPGFQTFAKRLGLANHETHLNCHINRRGIEKAGVQYDAHYYPVKDTDPDYDPDKHGFRFGYNSINYDMTILSKLLGTSDQRNFRKEHINQQTLWNDNNLITAKALRKFNNELFNRHWIKKMPMRLAHPDNQKVEYDYKGEIDFKNYEFTNPNWIIRKSWQLTGRYIDVSRLNEKPMMISLKRLLGMLGLKIMESDKLSMDSYITNIEDMAELLAYNISDVINLQTLFEHNIYQNSFNVRKKLIETYPQTVYGQKQVKDNPDQEAQVDAGNYMNIRKDRLIRDSTSARFVELALAPYKPIKDIRTVSYLYPSKKEADRLGIEQVDVLEDTKRYFEENITSDINNQAHKDFMEVYNFYDGIRGRNFNNSETYWEDYGHTDINGELTPMSNKHIKELQSVYNTNLFYHHVNRHGEPYRSSCMATFSIGGIHGAEINMSKYQDEMFTYQIEKDMQDYIESKYTSALEAINSDVWIDLPSHLPVPERIKPKIREKDGKVKIREFIKGGSTKKKAEWRDVKEVSLFERNSNTGSFTIRDKYKYVSVGPSHHADFTSYYPLLLSRLGIFINPSYHGYEDDAKSIPRDPYNDMFLERIRTRKIARDKTQDEHTREMADMEQESRKLLINAATGAGDTTYNNNIRANNGIMSMRIIGQMFAWRIGQAQSLAGGRVPSTNTDGLYTMDISAETHDRILHDTAKDMHIEIDPERLDRFVSKDSNNRLEVYEGKIQAASGGTLNSWSGPQPAQSLDHAAIIDHILVKYLADKRIENPANIQFDKEFARQLFDDFIQDKIQQGKPHDALLFFQWVVAGSSGTHRYPYLKRINKHTGKVDIESIQLINRVFLIKEENRNIRQEIHLATQRKVLKTTWDKRLKDLNNGKITRSQLRDHDEHVLEILKENGLDLLKENDDETSEYHRSSASDQKIRSMPDNQHIAIYNDDLLRITNEHAIQMIQELDIDAYVNILENTFKTWSNLEVA